MKRHVVSASDPTAAACSCGNLNGAVGMIFNSATRVWHVWISFYTSAHSDQFGNAFLHGGRFSDPAEARAAVEAISSVLERITCVGGTPAQMAHELAQAINGLLGPDGQSPAPLPASLRQHIRETVDRHRDLNAIAQEIAQAASERAGGAPISWSIRLGPPNGVEMLFREELPVGLN